MCIIMAGIFFLPAECELQYDNSLVKRRTTSNCSDYEIYKANEVPRSFRKLYLFMINTPQYRTDSAHLLLSKYKFELFHNFSTVQISSMLPEMKSLMILEISVQMWNFM